jgi:hypothetical protein
MELVGADVGWFGHERIHGNREARRRLVDRLDRGVTGRELPGTLTQALLETLRITLEEALETNRADARSAASEDFEEVRIAV